MLFKDLKYPGSTSIWLDYRYELVEGSEEGLKFGINLDFDTSTIKSDEKKYIVNGIIDTYDFLRNENEWIISGVFTEEFVNSLQFFLNIEEYSSLQKLNSVYYYGEIKAMSEAKLKRILGQMRDRKLYEFFAKKFKKPVHFKK